MLAEAGVARDPVPPEASYFAELARAFGASLASLISRGSRFLRVDPAVLWWLVAALAALALAVLVRALLPRLRRGRPGAAAAAATLPREAAVERDAAAWRAELERCLSEDTEERIGEALRAAWWWLARVIAGPKAQPDWTSRDLSAHTPRRDLRALLRRLDALTYGPARPGLAELRQLAEQLRGALG